MVENNSQKNWLCRLRRLRIGRRLSENDDDAVLRRNLPSSTNSEERGCSSTRTSFRKSLKKMHSRVKNAMFRQKSTNLDITIRSRVKPRENIYSLEPVQSFTTTPSINIADEATNGTHQTPRHGRDSLPELPNDILPLGHTEDQIQPVYIYVRGCSRRVPTDEIFSLSKCYWYWGPITRHQAEEKLQHAPDGAFLIRDSSSTSYLFSISFRSVGRTLHSRIEYIGGRYSLYDQEGFDSITELIENAIKKSENGVYCYSRNRDNNPNFPVRLTTPISRYTQVRSLKHLCRFVIRQCTNLNNIHQLPLPPMVKTYLQDCPYF